ncbi:amidase [Mycolicibacterium baixiangningiae]|uniref:amidase n=1 Tax=Mycolicibacterium baixiangningiae TaxID=2761578 RepID=UPI0018D0EE65|nr:amidase family protein [Mycolicibacterium baixiangningiae]
MSTHHRYNHLSPAQYVASSAVELGRRVATGELSPVQLVECALDLAAAGEQDLNAYAAYMTERALREAAQREDEAASGRIRSPLHGVPIASKDNLDIAGEVIGKGSLTTPDTPAAASSPMVERLLAAGTVIIGRTTTPEFGWKGTGISPRTGISRNPRDLRCNTGGSSAGSAATVAAGAVPIATGTDAGGSVRIPAAFCGVVGFKPTLGAIPVWPGTNNISLSHAGPLARSVRDARAMFDLSRGPDSRDPQSYFSHPRARSAPVRPRVAVVREPFGIAPSDTVAAVFDDTVRLLRQADIAEFSEMTLGGPPPREIFEALWVTGRGIGFGKVIEANATRMDPGLVRLATLARRYSAADMLETGLAQREFTAAMFGLLDTWDLLLMPTMPITAFAADAEVPVGGEKDADLPWVTWTPYTYPFNISGQPAITLPTHLASTGLPVGIQLVGAWSADDLVLDFAESCEAIMAPTNAAHTTTYRG